LGLRPQALSKHDFSALATHFVHQEQSPFFIDSEPDNLNLCPVALEEAIVGRDCKRHNPKAIIVVPLYGVYKIEEIRMIADKYNLILKIVRSLR
jgi:dTDP-4-amino-4,6-dideoxygalactose transaminase